MSESESSNKSIGFFGALTILFIGLKLGHVIVWSWLWVLSPLWIPAALFAVLILSAILLAIIL